MKKTISINIGGIIFHIEEDGYERLKNYLSSIQRYFSGFADSQEIVSDIEARVAERFYNKQKADSKQVISLVDVEELIGAMGTVADFQELEESEDILADPLEVTNGESTEGEPSHSKSQGTFATPQEEQARFAPKDPRKFYRDLKRKLIGGVAAGLANYFTVDPIWVRLAFLICVVGLPAGSGMMNLNLEDELGPISGIIVLVYLAMWVAFPGSSTLEEDTNIKKFYRDPDRKVVGGVAAGIASYFGIDLGVVRFLWVLSILFFGTGLLIYIVLWVIAPSANTLTEKMEMQGEPITLSNIESNIKQSLNLDAGAGEEPVASKIVLFPFRAIALIIAALGKIFKGLGPILRVFVGVILVGFSATALLGILIAASVALGVTSAVPLEGMPIPFLIFQELPASLIISAILLAIIPLIAFLMLGLTLLGNRRIVPPSVWLTMAGLWIVGIIGSTIGGIAYQRNFATRGEVVQTEMHQLPNGILRFDKVDDYEVDHLDLDIRLAAYATQDSLKIEKKMYSRGRNKEEAKRIAAKLTYQAVWQDSTLVFHEGPELGALSSFRNQRIGLTVFIPYDRPFIMSERFYHASQHWGDGFSAMKRYNLDEDDVDWNGLRWVMLRDSGLVCTNIPERFLRDEEEGGQSYSYDDSDSELDMGERGTYIKQFPVDDFNKIDLGGAYVISIRQGTEYRITADGEVDDVDDIEVRVDNGTLKVNRSDDFSIFGNNKWKRVGLVITTPNLERLELSGANKARVSGFKGLNKLYVDVSGASQTEIDVETNQLLVDMSGASKLTLKGSASQVELDISGACKVDATRMGIGSARVSASGASRAEMGRVGNIEKHTSGASKVEVNQ
ncbi:phage shock protein PspC (stress-responsive transcriptional regulator) [Dyadobacter jejuensis]|uniref:Phage shock protein PspC (Stress-responsive transcriptional regulator) n=1 Tax=Dyadobacter jejuensis TaxID=1082580 RepID=A0A316BCK2_9BACT|nr:PspC domain-containing protein [Dyadobacter jejuensis]PWJ60187.1 phage shock protein PspC (stress-responsive transcriptional regulator) [Dyadobacter jejuensis]